MNTNDTTGTPENPTGSSSRTEAAQQAQQAGDGPTLTADSTPAQPDGTTGGPALLRTGATIPTVRELLPGEEIITLPSGAVAIMGKTYGKNVRLASRICDGDPDMYGVAMLCTCTEVNGEGLTPHAFDVMSSKDAEELMAAFNAKNA